MLIFLFAFLAFNPAFSLKLMVPGTYTTIQVAINASVNGDTVVVAPGTYFENINFRGRNIVVTSQYYLNKTTSFISSTIIDGSAPVFPDTASCVIFNHGETGAAVLQGFTIRGGGGSKWQDIHGGGKYREGGGILIEQSSPTITHNIITNNLVTNAVGVTATGGGGIRIGDGNPVICSNAILFNQASYGPGIVLNYSGGRITNNVIASNTGGNKFSGGSGIWVLESYSLATVFIENNTIVNNTSSLAGGTGGVLIWSATNVSVRNNIIYGNLPAVQVKTITSSQAVTYCNIQGGYSGTGNVDQDPFFDANSYYLGTGSPCIDAGDPALMHNDIENLSSPGNALFPSLALLRNDMGAYGGPCASDLPAFTTSITITTGLSENLIRADLIEFYPNPIVGYSVLHFNIPESQKIKIELYSLLGQSVLKLANYFMDKGHRELVIQKPGLDPGTYLIKIEGEHGLIASKKIIISE